MGIAETARRQKRIRVVLIKPSKYDDEGYVIRHFRGVLPSNTLACLSSLTQDAAERKLLGEDTGIEIELFDDTVQKIPVGRIIRSNRLPGRRTVVALVGVQSNQFPRAADLAKKFRAGGLQVLIGGFHVSGMLALSDGISPEIRELMDLGVTVVKGEVEETWGDLLRDAAEDRLRPLYDFLDRKPDIYAQPLPRVESRYLKRFIISNFGTIDCSRGCPFNCTFCSNPSLKKLYRSKGKFVRFRSPVNVVTEIRQVMSSSRLSFCQFVDELMISDKEWLRDFLAQYRKMIRLPFSCPVHARILDETTVKDLRDAGCDCVSFGVETGNEVLRRTVLGKDVSNSDIIAAAGLLKKHGIRCKTFNMFGLPNETVENALETLRLNRMIRPDYLFASIVQFLPGTELTEYAMREGIIDKDFAVKSTASYFKSSIARMRDIKKIIRLQKLFAALVHLPIPERAVRILLSLHLDVLYEAVFVVTYGIMVVRSARKRFLNTLLIGVKLMRFFRS